MKKLIYSLFTLLVLCSCEKESDDLRNKQSISVGDILFCSDSSVYSMDKNGDNRMKLAVIDNNIPKRIDYSSSEKRILFLTNRYNPNNVEELYTMNVDGTGIIQITNIYMNKVGYAFSSDEEKIAYGGSIPFTNGKGVLRIVNSDGTNDREVDFPTWVQIYRTNQLSWSENDSTIAFSGDITDTLGIYSQGIFSINLYSGNLKSLLVDTLRPSYLQYSPDGSKIAFIGLDDISKNYNVYMMDSNGNKVKKVTNLIKTSGSSTGQTNVSAQYVSWSSDSKELTFTANAEEKDFEVYTVNADGTNITRLTINNAFESSPIWTK